MPEFKHPFGSLNINDIQLCVGHIYSGSTLDLLEKGRKYIIAGQHDIHSQCYSIFVGSKGENSAHQDLAAQIRCDKEIAQIGEIMGGGLIEFTEDHTYQLTNYSRTYQKEPDAIRARFSALLLEPLRIQLGIPDLQQKVTEEEPSFYDKHVYRGWFVYKQVLDAVV